MTGQTIEPPAGYALRRIPSISGDALRARPVTTWSRQLGVCLDAGGDSAWVHPSACSFTGGDVNALLARGALLVAERRGSKLYRLTPLGVRSAR